jgi:hypothetical protein
MLGGRGAGSARSPAFPLLGRKGPLHWWRAPIVGRREQRHDRPARDGRGRARGRGRGRAGDRRALPVSAANIGAVADPPVRELYEPLRSLAMQRVEVALRVAVMVRAGISRAKSPSGSASARSSCAARSTTSKPWPTRWRSESAPTGRSSEPRSVRRTVRRTPLFAVQFRSTTGLKGVPPRGFEPRFPP